MGGTIVPIEDGESKPESLKSKLDPRVNNHNNEGVGCRVTKE